jgi:hypothetical protein
MDVSLLERENALLGQDFLTWLWYRGEKSAGAFETKKGEAFRIAVEQRVSVQGGEGEMLETATVQSPRGELSEARTGLRTGKKVNRAQLKIEQDGVTWQLSLRAEDFGASSLKTPKIEAPGEGADPDALFLEKLFLIERCLELLDAAFAEFLAVRLTRGWPAEARRIKAWVAEP